MINMNRREFVGWMTMGAIVTSVIGCNTDTGANSNQEGDASNEFQVVGTVDELEAEGSLTDEMTDVIVLRNAEGELVALNRTCPHQNCAVDLDEEAEQLACPCHDSQFTLEGELVEGPAQTGLTNYEVKIEDNEVLVKVS